MQLTELGKAGLDLHNSGDVNVISTDMGDLKGNALSWQPQDINKACIIHSSTCGLLHAFYGPRAGTYERPFPLPPQIDIRKGNAFHCSALFLRSLWADEGIAFRPVLAWGWEDWDFWIRVHDKVCQGLDPCDGHSSCASALTTGLRTARQVGLRPVYIRKPVFLYSSAGARRDKKAHMASFCSDHMPFCKAVLQLANSRLYNVCAVTERGVL